MTMVENRLAGFEVARKAMVDSQLRPSGVNAPFVLKRMGSIPREDFVPESAKSLAYIDRSIALGDGRYLAPAAFYGTMLQEALPVLQDRALVVDGGSGYLPRLLDTLVGTVEVIDPAAAFQPGGASGFTLLLVDGAVEKLPSTLMERLADDGRVVTGIVLNELTRLAYGRKALGDAALLPLAEMGIPVLREFAAPKAWSF
ncbi:protein-L-isoaspartate O-methyltransferase family protein [Altericroceibacterium xinjiangense]|uniref:protein-L-isoaspartate O-methyltransferase family protein n=1 Tax=Altericroceibacterium xinjiangense TaxID=762261 RepID=UPI000F7F7E9C|nr:protein-L-isoaspartate O-methyltransferase [Altericroceibacterium xinjiangense]